MKRTRALEQYIIDNISIPAYFNAHVIGLKPGLTPLSDTSGSASICPFHDDVNPSFRYWKAKQFFMCFGCNCSGDVINLHRLTLQRKIHKPVMREAAIQDLCRIYNIKYVARKKAATGTSTNIDLGDADDTVTIDSEGTTVVEDISVFEKCRRQMNIQPELVEHRKHFNLIQFQQRNALIRDNPNLNLSERFKMYDELDEMACTAINATEDRFEVAANLRLEDIPSAI